MAGRDELPQRQETDAVRFNRYELVILGRWLLVIAEQRGLRRPVYIRVNQADFLAGFGKRDGEVGRNGRFADAALAASDRDDRAMRLRSGERDPRFLDAGHLQCG